MSAYGSVIVSAPPSGWVFDFDLVWWDGDLLLVGTCDVDFQVCSWEPATDHWTVHPLADASLAEGVDYTELTALGATALDGGIVVGGGGEHQGFAIWDLASGAVRLHEEPGSVGSASVLDVGGRRMFVVGASDGPGVTLWDPAAAESEGQEDWRDAVSMLSRPSVYDHQIRIEELETASYASSAIAAGTLSGRPVVVGGDGERVLVWNARDNSALAVLEPPADLFGEAGPTDFGLLELADGPRVLAAGGQHLALGDPGTGEWDDPLTMPEADVSCLDTYVAGGRAIAVTGAEDGSIGVWDLRARRMLGEPLREHGNVVYGVRVVELDGRPMLFSTAHDDPVRVWELPI